VVVVEFSMSSQGKVQPCADEAENVQSEMLWNERSGLGKQPQANLEKYDAAYL